MIYYVNGNGLFASDILMESASFTEISEEEYRERLAVAIIKRKPTDGAIYAENTD